MGVCDVLRHLFGRSEFRPVVLTMGRSKQRRMSAAEFDAVMLLMPTMSAQRRAAARLGLVEGLTGKAIADQFGWGRSAVNNAETVIWRVRERYLKAKAKEARAEGRLPAGWKSIRIAGPTALVSKVEREVAAALGTRDAPKNRRKQKSRV